MDTPFLIRPIRSARDQPAQPAAHGHDYQEVIIITEGEAFHRIDWEARTMTGPHAVLVARGKVHAFRTGEGTRGWVIDFDPALLPRGASWLFSQFFALSKVPLLEAPCRSRIQRLCELMEEHQGLEGHGETQAYLLAALLAQLETLVPTLRGKPERDSDFHMVKKFLGVLDTHYHHRKDLDFYARRLKVNPRRLTSVCKQIMGRTAAGLLEERCMVEARRFLAQSDLTVQQIAERLGYDDPSYFTKVFRKVAKDTPGRFRATWAALNH